MEFFTDLSDRASEQISGGKNDKWGSPGGGEQVIPPGLIKKFEESGFIPEGLNDDPPGSGSNVPLHGNKNGFETSDIGIVPPGWTV